MQWVDIIFSSLSIVNKAAISNHNMAVNFRNYIDRFV